MLYELLLSGLFFILSYQFFKWGCWIMGIICIMGVIQVWIDYKIDKEK